MPLARSASAMVFEMKPAAIYARFSTELQNEKSTEDQIALCRTYAARHQLNIVATFEDKARSGASVFGRDGLMQLMDAARQNLFSVVIVGRWTGSPVTWKISPAFTSGCLSRGSKFRLSTMALL